MGEVFKVTPTADPSRVSFRVLYSTANLRDGDMPNVGDPYRKLAGADTRRVTEEGHYFGWGDYVYADQEKSESDGFITLIYVRPRTPEEIAKAVPYRSFPSNEDGVYWPPVLERLPTGEIIKFSLDNSFPFVKDTSAGRISTPRVLVDYALRKQYDGPTSVRTDYYISSKPWSERALRVIHPQPSHVYWDQTGSDGDLGFCLHDEIIIPALGATTTLVSGASASSTSAPVTQGKILPPTNYVSWQDRVIDAKQVYADGNYLITIKTAKAPPMYDIVAPLR